MAKHLLFDTENLNEYSTNNVMLNYAVLGVLTGQHNIFKSHHHIE